MRNKLKYLVIPVLLFFAISLYAQSYHVRIGFIGNSITIGSGLSNPTVECYPSQLRLLLQEKYGDTCIITNYAVSGRTLLKKGDYPWWKEPDFLRCWNYAPDICFIMLGTNDSKPYNWDVYGNEFFGDYQALIDTFKVRNPATKFIVCRPPPAFAVVWDIRDSVIVNGIIPLVDSIAKTNGTDVVNFREPLLDSVYLFPDKIHPNAKGAKVLAKIAFDEIVSSDIIHEVQPGHPFVTSLTSSVPGDLRLSDSATISWTTINATEAFFNGIPVNPNGSIRVGPTENTSYSLVARSDTASDSLAILQKVYIPELFRFVFTATTRSMHVGDTSTIKLFFYDQNNKLISDSIYDVDWSLSQGYGHFVNDAGKSIQFVGDSAGTAKVLCTYGSITYSLSFYLTAKPATSVPERNQDGFSVYPNPFNNKVFVDVPAEKTGKLFIQLFSADGKLCRTETRQVRETGNQRIELNTARIREGIYMMVVEFGGEKYSKIIIKE
ncbi:MAG: GDSL-type esterase/lipase family protein [Bacteroidales bacterium]